MTTQVFRGKTLVDARKMATQTLGSEAVIVATREVKRAGLVGLFGGMDFEVAAATLPTDRTSPPSGPFARGVYGHTDARHVSSDASGSMAAHRAEVRGEIRAMKLALSRSAASANFSAELLAIRETLDQLTPPSSRGDKGARLVAARGIEGAAAKSLLREMREDKDGEMTERLRRALAKLLQVGPLPLASRTRTLVAAIGPAGVGKTTMIAKLATLAKLDGRSVTMITCDTFRVGAVEQTKRYASLLNVRHEVARDAKGLAALISSTKDDVILVDTSGRPARSDSAESLLAPERMAAIQRSEALSRHVLLCMPASVRWLDAVRTTRQFAGAKPSAVVVTKTDETDAPSGLVHAVLASTLPLVAICTGPRVPEDIDAAAVDAIVARVLGCATNGGKAR